MPYIFEGSKLDYDTDVGNGDGDLPKFCILEWSIGLSDYDEFIMRAVYVSREHAYNMMVKDGYLWYNDVKTDWSFIGAGIR